MTKTIRAACALLALTQVPLTPVRRTDAVASGDSTVSGGGAVTTALADVLEGFGYMLRTPWLLATLLFASLMILAMMGPFEVLIPFLVKDRLGGGPGDHAMVMAAFGIGGALGSLAMASVPMPRRYLTWMILLWGLGCLPLVVMAYAFLGLAPPASGASAAAFAASLVATVALSAAITTFLSVTVLVTVSGRGVHVLMTSVVNLFSGALVPLPLFPGWLQRIADVLPFRGLMDTPFRLYMAHLPPGDALVAVAHLVGWTLALVLGGRWLLARALRRVVVQGG